MLQEQPFEVFAVVEDFFEDPQHFLAVIEMRGKPVDIDHDVHDGYTGHLMHVLMQERTDRIVYSFLQLYRLVVFFHLDLTLHNLVDFFEDGLFIQRVIFFVLQLNDVIQSIQIL